jgi:methylmalonyl-CoA mutase
LQQGLIQSQVAAVHDERQAALARRADVLTGISDFVDLDEAAVAVLDVAPVAAPPATFTFEPLPRIRLAEPFEELREAVDRMQADTGARPKVFLANLGLPADFSARATFAKNFFAAGGIAAVTNDGFARPAPAGGETDLAALVAAYKSAGAALVCLCGSDETYRREAVAAAKALTQAGAPPLYCVARPAEEAKWEAELAAAGNTSFIYAGCNAVAALQAAHEQITSRRR